MPVNITIIGLGQIGGSVGLALAAHADKVFTTGHDKEYGREQQAKKMGAVQATNHNLPASVEKADVVLLALPVDQIRETFKYIANDLRNDAVVMDTAPVKAEVAMWAKELLPQGVHYVGLLPAIGAAYLHEAGNGLDSAQADLFQRGVCLISAPSGTPGAAIKLAADLVDLLGASAMHTDFTESDGLAAVAHILPMVTSAALVNASINQPGWVEMRKIASRAYFASTASLEGLSSTTLSMQTLQNRDNVLRALTVLMNALYELREDLENKDDEALSGHLRSAIKGRERWLTERSKADWTQMPGETMEKPSLMESLLGSKLGKMGKRS